MKAATFPPQRPAQKVAGGTGELRGDTIAGHSQESDASTGIRRGMGKGLRGQAGHPGGTPRPRPEGKREPCPPAPAAAPHHEVAGEVVLPIVVRVLHGLDSLNEFPQDLLLAHPAPPAALRSGSPSPSPGRCPPEPPPPHQPVTRLPSPCLASLRPAPGPAPRPASAARLPTPLTAARPPAPSSPPSARPSLDAAADTGTRRSPHPLPRAGAAPAPPAFRIPAPSGTAPAFASPPLVALTAASFYW